MLSLKTRAAVALVSLASLALLFWYVFSGETPDSYTPEEINDMFQNKKSEVRVRRIEVPNHGIQSPYLDKHTLQLPHWDLLGDIIVENGHHISLTSDGKYQQGLMVLKQPLAAESFEMELTFHLHGKNSKILADGMALWFVEEKPSLGEAFGASNNFKGLAIALDTYANANQIDTPLLSAHYGQGFVHFDKHSDGIGSMRASCSAKLLVNPASRKLRLRIVHTKNGYLSVDFNQDPDGADSWHNCFSVLDVHLPSQFYLALSADTGGLSESVDIFESKLFALYLPDGDHFIESVDELENIMEQQALLEPRQDSPEKKQTRKSVSRLRNAEKRIKERERAYRMEKYGDPDATFVRRWWLRIFVAAKYTLLLVVVLLALWVVRLVIKSRRSRRGRYSGLLD